MYLSNEKYEVNIIFSHGFKFYIDYDAEAGGKVLLNENDVETVCLLSKLHEAKHHVTNLNIAQVKQKHGIIEREKYNKPKSENSRQPGRKGKGY